MNRKHPLRILIADDIAQWRVTANSILKAKANWQVVGEASNGLQTVQMTAELFPDLVLLDIGMPILNGIEVARQIHEAHPTTKIIFLTQENDADVRQAALATGADEYVLKTNAASELMSSIETVCGLIPAIIPPPTRQ